MGWGFDNEDYEGNSDKEIFAAQEMMRKLCAERLGISQNEINAVCESNPLFHPVKLLVYLRDGKRIEIEKEEE